MVGPHDHLDLSGNFYLDLAALHHCLAADDLAITAGLPSAALSSRGGPGNRDCGNGFQQHLCPVGHPLYADLGYACPQFRVEAQLYPATQRLATTAQPDRITTDCTRNCLGLAQLSWQLSIINSHP